MKAFLTTAATIVFTLCAAAQNVTWTQSTDGDFWRPLKTKLESKPSSDVILTADANAQGIPFRAWGTTFNELDWNAFLQLSRDEQDEIMQRLFSPDGELRFTRGRIPMNASDYAASWYSCDEVPGDFELRYFNIDRDKKGIIPLIRAAQKYNPDMRFWISPWSPPSWMKINNDYPVVSSRHNTQDPRKDYLLFGRTDSIDEDEMKFLGERNSVFPRRLATQDYMIQDPRYLKAYADYFCRFINEYASQGVPIDMVIYQNEAYSYTPYPGCPWTAEGTIRFNRDYLYSALKKSHPEVELYLGTFNTNRQDHVERILSDSLLRQRISGLGFQWEGREIMPEIRKQYPDFHYICSESECGNGDMDWKAGEHTFFLIADNLGNGADEWYNWNFILPVKGESPWGWKQNALIELNPETRSYRYTPEYFAVRHFSNAITPQSRMIGYTPFSGENKTIAIAYSTPEGKTIIVAGNFNNDEQTVSFKVGNKYLNATLPAHSFNTFTVK